MHPMLNIAVRAARNAGRVISQSLENPAAIEAMQKGQNDLVTNIDKQAEKAVIDTIRKSYPDHTIISEEAGELEGADKDTVWIVDPLDGTTNFVKGIPHYCVSIAIQVKGKVEHAVVYDPLRNELFSASKGQGAQLNERRIRVNNARDLTGTVLATAFPHRQKHHMAAYLKMVENLFVHAADMRRAGSAALDLAYVAAGRVDGFFEIGLKPWDTAAGQLLVREAGGLVTDFVGGSNQDRSGNIVAGSAKVVQGILKEIRNELTESLRR